MRSAQWMSSTSRTKGRRSAEISSARLTAQNVSSAENDSSISPIADPTRWVTSSWPGSIAASLTRAASRPSSAPIPAAARTTSPIGQYVTPSPYERQRPFSVAASALTRSRNSLRRRDFPTPAGPKTVTMWHRFCSTD